MAGVSLPLGTLSFRPGPHLVHTGRGVAAKADFLQTSIDCLLPVASSFLIKGQVKSWVRHVNVGGQTVREVMRETLCSVRADTSLHELARVLLEERVTELPVVDEANILMGQVNMYEIIKAYLLLRLE